MAKIKLTSTLDPSSDFVLYEGDVLDLLKTMPDEFVKLVVTSPPYNIGKEYENKIGIDKYISGQEKVIKECVRVLDRRGSLCWQVGNFEEYDYNTKKRDKNIWRF
ncbi:MAG: hypothetical protein DRP89_06130 [Candidatus Neomarinimicrobiota bacterium]|nr:MAG: hypothetical protein DRP89_06130 [Candidatus Neomarinimicrobiota bacterium]